MPVLEDDEPVHAPHPPLATYYEGEEGRRPFVRAVVGVSRYVEPGIFTEYTGTKP